MLRTINFFYLFLACLWGCSIGSAWADSAPLRVLWWNAHDGQANLNSPNSNFLHSLEQIIGSEKAPDILALAEYQESILSQNLLGELRRQYPYSEHAGYPGSPDYGVTVYSHYPILHSRIEILDFTPIQAMSMEARRAYREGWCGTSQMCARPVIFLDVQFKNKIVNVVATHLFDCWRQLLEKEGYFAVAEQLLIGEENPLWYQIIRFRKTLESIFGAKLNLGNLVILGDFNTPKEVLGATTRAYGEISSSLKDAILGNAPSFPSPDSLEAGHFPAFQIDHIFVSHSVRVTQGEVLRISGSDHFPVVATLEL